MHDDLSGSRAHHDGSLVERLDGRLEAAQRFRERNVHLHGEVATVALEDAVILLLELNYDIALLLSGLVVALAVESKPMRRDGRALVAALHLHLTKL